MSFQIFLLVGHLTNWTGHNLLTDNTLKERTQDVLVTCSVIVSDHNVKLAGHFQNLVGQCLMTDCYFQHWLASRQILKSSIRSKACYDKTASSAVLYPGDRVLVRNLSEKGGPGKLRAYWEQQIHVVEERMADSPVYRVVANRESYTVICFSLVMACPWICRPTRGWLPNVHAYTHHTSPHQRQRRKF